jgi:hypothetical protein
MMEVDKTDYGCLIVDTDFHEQVAVEAKEVPQLIEDLARAVGVEVVTQIFCYDPDDKDEPVGAVVIEEPEIGTLVRQYPGCIYFFAEVIVL